MSKSIHIAIDGNEANVHNRVGSNVYAFYILQALEKLTRRKNIQTTVYLSSKKGNDLPNFRKGWKYKTITPKKLWTQWRLPIELFYKRKEIDVFFTPGHYAPRLCPMPYVSSVMDLAFLHFPKQFKKKDYQQLKNWTQYSVQKANHVITISKASKNDIVDSYDRESTDITVAYPSLPPIKKDISNYISAKVLRKFRINNPYILYVGTLQPRKNIIQLIEAFEKLVRRIESQKVKRNQKKKKKKNNTQYENVQLVIAGKIGWLADDIVTRAKKSPFAQRIQLIGYVDEKEKAVLYKHAKCTALVGLYEGFGIPPLESLAYGVIPVVSNTSSLPEVVGKAGIKVDPHNAVDIMKGLDRALHMNDKERRSFQKRAQQQVQKFDWEKSGKKILDILLNIAKGNT